MNTHVSERITIGALKRCSTLEVLAAQIALFHNEAGKEPDLIQIAKVLKPIVLRELAIDTGVSIDAMYRSQGIVLGNSVLQFTALPVGEYAHLYGEGGKLQIL